MFQRRFSPLLLFIGVSQTIVTEVPQESVSGTVGQSVLLPVTYSCQAPFSSPLPILWNFSKTPNLLASYTVTNCSVGADGIPARCSGPNFIHPSYQDRAVLFPDNASLLLQNLQLRDSGVYTVTMRGVKTREISLTVTTSQLINRPTESSDATTNNNFPTSASWVKYTAGGCSAVLFLLLLLFFCRWYCGAAGSKPMRIIKQEQVQNPEASPGEYILHLQSTCVITRKPQEHSLTRSEPPIEYATIGFTAR